MKPHCALLLTLIFAGCVHVSNPQYKALDANRNIERHMRQAEKLMLPSVTFTDISLSKVAGVFFICNEQPPEFQNTIILENDRVWSDQKVNISFENVSFARLCDEICLQTGSVWWADKVIYIAKKK